MKFSDLQFETHPIGDGVHAKHFFPDGYGVSVVSFPGSYGYTEGLYEVAVLKGTEEQWHISYETSVTDDVMGHRDERDVEIIMEEVAAL